LPDAWDELIMHMTPQRATSCSRIISNGLEKGSSNTLTEDEVRRNAFAMPINNPAFPPGPYRFINRECLCPAEREP
jgi:hypothetical protein